MGQLGGLQGEHQALRLHTGLTEEVMKVTAGESFNAALEIQQSTSLSPARAQLRVQTFWRGSHCRCRRRSFGISSRSRAHCWSCSGCCVCIVSSRADSNPRRSRNSNVRSSRSVSTPSSSPNESRRTATISSLSSPLSRSPRSPSSLHHPRTRDPPRAPSPSLGNPSVS